MCIFWACICPCNWCSVCKVVKEYEDIVHFRLGKVVLPVKGSGFWCFIPTIDSTVIVDKREKTIDVPRQQMLTRDFVTVTVNAVVYYRVLDSLKAVLMTKDFCTTTQALATSSLRATVGESTLDTLLQKRDVIASKLCFILDSMSDTYGVDVTRVEIKDILLPQNMQRQMAAQAEAERVRIGKIISSQAELEASKTLLLASEEMDKDKSALTLRYLDTIRQIAGSNNKTTVIPIPSAMLHNWSNMNIIKKKKINK